MKIPKRILLCALVVLLSTVGLRDAAAAPADDVRVHTGVIDGAEFRAEVPARCNGTVPVYSHGSCPAWYLPEGVDVVSQDATKLRHLRNKSAPLQRPANGRQLLAGAQSAGYRSAHQVRHLASRSANAVSSSP